VFYDGVRGRNPHVNRERNIVANNRIPRALTIAGSDSGGGAGIEADLKTFTALRVYGMAALTSITAQNTVAVTGVHDVPPTMVAAQIDAVAQDIGVDAAKTGMLSSAAIVETVADALRRNEIPNVVVDPVMVAKSGARLLEAGASKALVRLLFPLARLVTPNIPEVEALAGARIRTGGDVAQAARALHALGPQYVLIKGGHLEDEQAVDYLFDGRGVQAFAAPRIDTNNTHGTGCTLSAAVVAGLARGLSVPNAVQAAKEYVTEALKHALALGHGHGPLNHFWAIERN